MSHEIFDKLLADFQNLWCELGSRPFDLRWHNLSGHQMILSGNPFSGQAAIKEWRGKERPPFDVSARTVVSRLSLPMDEERETFTLGFDVVTLPACESVVHARKAFQSLSAQAGAALPAEIRNKLAGFVGPLNHEPAAWWYAVLFAMNGESPAYMEGDQLRYHHEITVQQPLLLSVHAIQSLGLHTVQKDVSRQLELIAEKIDGLHSKPPRDGRRAVKSVAVEEANGVLMKLLEGNQALIDCTKEQLAEAVEARTGKQCSATTVFNTRIWKQLQEQKKTRAALARPQTLEKSIFEAVVTPDRMVCYLASEITREEAEKAIESSSLRKDKKIDLLDKLELGKIDPAQAMDILRKAQESEADERKETARDRNRRESMRH